MKTILIISFFFIAIPAFSQNTNINVIGFGDGTTKTDAINAALRNCIEKTFGVFVTTNSQVSNDELVKDEIATFASGNIVSYDLIDVLEKNSVYSVSVAAIVSPDNIVKAFKNKGYSFEVNGNVYFQNIQKEKFYKEQEPKIIFNFLLKYINYPVFDSFSIKIENPILSIDESKRNSKYWSSPEFWEAIPKPSYPFYNTMQIWCGNILKSSALDNYKQTLPLQTDKSFFWKIKESKDYKTQLQLGGKSSQNPYEYYTDSKNTIYSLPILFTPHYNIEIADSLSMILNKFFESIQVSDIANYEKLYGETYEANVNLLQLRKNKKGNWTSKKEKFSTYHFRNPQSLAIIYKYSFILNIRSTPESISTNELGFTPELPSLYYKPSHDEINHIFKTRTFRNEKESQSITENILNLLKQKEYIKSINALASPPIINLFESDEGVVISELEQSKFLNKKLGFNAFPFRTYLIILNLNEAELSKLKNINFSWIPEQKLVDLFIKEEKEINDFYFQNLEFISN